MHEVKLYLRTLRQIIEDLLRHLGYRDLHYLHFEYRECNGERIFGPANGGLWWQITVRKIGQGHVLIALVVFQDGSWVKMNLSCEPLYGPCSYFDFQNDQGLQTDFFVARRQSLS